MQNNSTDQTRNALGQILKTQEALRAWRDLKLKPSELPNKEQFERGRSIANQNTLMRLMYSAVSENLLPEGTEVTLRYAQTDRRPEKSVYVSGAASILRELYTRDVEQPLQFDITINGTSYSVDSPTEFWQSILVPNVVEQGLATQEHCDQALYELVNSVNNEMLSMASMLKTRENLKSVAGGSHNMWEWLVRHADQEMSRQNTGVNNPAQLLSTQQYIERLGSFKGHPTHPMAKMKGRRSSATDESFTPLSVEEVVKYSPEFGNEVSLLLVSVDADHLNAVGEDGGVSAEEYLEFFAREYPIAYKTWEEDAPQAKASGKLPVPIHPLQIEEIKRQMPELLESGIVAMPSYEEQIRARPTISMRTLMTPDGHQV